MADLFARQLGTWKDSPPHVQQMIIDHVRKTIKGKTEGRHGMQRDRREGYTDDWAAVEAELQRELSSETPRQHQHDERGLASVDTGTTGVVRRSRHPEESQESDLSFDYPRSAAARVLAFLECDGASADGSQDVTVGGTVDNAGSFAQSSRLSLSLEDCEPGRRAAGEYGDNG